MASSQMRLSGINTGFDTEAMIKQMMSAYQTKIDKQNKKLQTLQWQQEAYRDVTSKLKTFKSKYFDILKRDNYLMSPNSFKKFSSTITNKSNPGAESGLKVSTTSNSKEANYDIEIQQLATSAQVKGASLTDESFKLDMQKAINTSSYTLSEDGSTRSYEFELDVKVGDVSKTIKFGASLAQNADGTVSEEASKQFAVDIASTLNDKLHTEFGETNKGKDGSEFFVSAAETDDKGFVKFTIGGNSAVTVTEKSGNFNLAKPSYQVAIATQAATTGKNTVAVTVGGVTKNVEFEGVSENYYDTKDLKGNEAILKEYNDLKRIAYIKDKKAIPTDEQLESYTYTAVQAAKDKNSAALSTALNAAFKDEGVSFKIDGSYVTASKGGEKVKFSMTSTGENTLGLTKGSVTNKLSDRTLLADLGVKVGENNNSFTINGAKIEIDEDTTIAGLIEKVNKSGAGVTMSYSNLENRFIVASNDLGSAGKAVIEDNAITQALKLTSGAGAVSKDGENAIISVNGTTIYHNSNSYTTDGTTFDFSDVELKDKDGSDITVKTSVNIGKSYDDIKKSIKEFVKDYNQLIDDVYGHIDTARVRDKNKNYYEPLTDEEKESMSEKEIEKWETAAKKGVIYHDSTVTSIMSQIRIALYNSVELDDGKKFGLYNMGITTDQFKNSEHGKLIIDEDKLDKAFAENPDAVTKLFTDSETGIMSKVNKVIDNAVRDTGKVKGTLIRKAGLETGSTSKDNQIYKEMTRINERLDQLQERYNKKEDYWWKVFTNLEKMQSQFDMQQSYLQQFTASGGYFSQG